MNSKVTRTDDEWRQLLTQEQYMVTRMKGTERPFSGEYYSLEGQGTFRCVACGQPLFDANTKFESGTGWPSFWSAIAEDAVDITVDNSHGMTRTEVTCSRCGAHLGHLFEDGPAPTGWRYCINSVALDFEAEE